MRALGQLFILAIGVPLGVLGFCAGKVRGDGPLGAEGAPITTSQYSIDGTRGTVLGGSRVTGLAGAFSAIAEGIEGGLTNPASVAVRSAGSVDFWDFWLGLGFTYPLENGDYFNDGGVLKPPEDTKFFFLNPGGYLQLWSVGFGLDVEIQTITLRTASDSPEGERELKLQIISNHVQAGSLLFDGNLVIGGGMQVLRERALGGKPDTNLDKILTEYGFGGELGVLIRPNGRQWRLGAGIYSKVEAGSSSSSSDRMFETLYLPTSAIRPWQGSLAFAYQFGDRPFNPRFTYVDEVVRKQVQELKSRGALAQHAHEQRMARIRAESGTEMAAHIQAEEEAHAAAKEQLVAERDALEQATWRRLRKQVRTGWPRRYLLLTSELTFTGRVDQAVGITSFVTGTVQRSGEHLTVTPRLAAEAEVWPTRVKVRTGVYLEPTRFRESDPRVHGTFGVDVRVFHWDVFGIWPEDYLWQITAAFDGTKDYAVFSMGIGGWY